MRHADEVLRTVGVSPGHYLLDLGCGEGAFTLPAGRRVGEAGMVFALDCDPEKLAVLRRAVGGNALNNVALVQASGEAGIPLAEGTCDVALVYDVLQMIEDWEPLFAELFRVLRAGGTLSVYPMHVDAGRVKGGCAAAGLVFRSTWQDLLNFVRP